MLRNPAQSVPWLGILILTAGALIAMIARKLYRTYAAFAAYLVVVLLYEATTFWMSSHRTHSAAVAHWFTFWAGEILKGIICVLVLVDLYFQLFRNYEGLRRFARALFQWAAALLFFVSALFAVTTQANTDWLTRLVLVIDATATIFIC